MLSGNGGLAASASGAGIPLSPDPGMMEQIVMNLAVNGRDAMPKGGQLLISTHAESIDADYVQHHAEARVGQFNCLSVKDTGCGMNKDTLSRVFEPFFTTKEVGKGTGLGLATVYGIVKQHRGWIEVTSEPGIGTTFKIYLPGCESKQELDRNVDVKPNSLKGNMETILLVEDEPVLRELARMVLQSYNYNVIEASTGREALKVYQEHPGEVDLLLTDMVMPEGMTGRELAEDLRKQKPDLKVVYTSGYSADIMGNEAELNDSMFLQKPYPPPQLAHTVRACLDQSLQAKAA
jgi:CheY-like chemotaxis protein